MLAGRIAWEGVRGCVYLIASLMACMGGLSNWKIYPSELGYAKGGYMVRE
jgi:hypothetical protein